MTTETIRLARTLAIDPGRRELGYAVLEDSVLLYYGVRGFGPGLSPRRLTSDGVKFVDDLIKRFGPATLVVGRTRYPGSRRAPMLDGFVDAMRLLARRHGIGMRSYEPRRVKEVLAGDPKATRVMIISKLIADDPLLNRFSERDRKSQGKYWENMFDALALGLTAYHERRPPPAER